MLIIHGVYHFRRKNVAFRNDYCLSCNRPRRSVRVRTFEVGHIFWIPIVPAGFWKYWLCTECDNDPHQLPGTRRTLKWAGLVVLIMLAVIFWITPVPSDFVTGAWICRIGAPIGAILLFLHLINSPPDPKIKELLSSVLPAADVECPFCGTQLLVGTNTHCPACGVARV